ncbi:MAG: GLPGLI family protein [Chitinophagaceae bacterium]
MNKIALLISSFCLTLLITNAQPKFILQGKVEYEKKQNMHKKMGDGAWAEEMKSKLPQFRVTYFDLVFNEKESVYKAGREVEDKFKNMWGDFNGDNITYNNYDSGKTTTQKQVFEKLYLVKDSLVNIEWRITNESRTIAGFDCRKAVGRLFDSIYVVAFYTDEIVVPAGPESFSGLPGLILGLALPRLNTTWFATKLELKSISAQDLAIPSKGKKTTRKDMFATVKTATKDWGTDGAKYMLEAVL